MHGSGRQPQHRFHIRRTPTKTNGNMCRSLGYTLDCIGLFEEKAPRLEEQEDAQNQDLKWCMRKGGTHITRVVIYDILHERHSWGRGPHQPIQDLHLSHHCRTLAPIRRDPQPKSLLQLQKMLCSKTSSAINPHCKTATSGGWSRKRHLT